LPRVAPGNALPPQFSKGSARQINHHLNYGSPPLFDVSPEAVISLTMDQYLFDKSVNSCKEAIEPTSYLEITSTSVSDAGDPASEQAFEAGAKSCRK